MRAFTLAGKMRPKRPGREQMKEAIVATKANISELAAKLRCSRPTAYKWIDQLGLREFAGIRNVDNVDGADDVGERHTLDGPHTSKRAKKGETRVSPRALGVVIFPDMTSDATLPDTFRRQRSVSMSEGWWRWVRVEAAQSDRRAADVIEAALGIYEAHLARKRSAIARKENEK